MTWDAPITTDDIVAIHAALVPTINGDGEILLFGGDNHFHLGAIARSFDHSARMNCRNPGLPLVRVRSPAFDLFCCGHAFSGDGRLIVAGGTQEFKGDALGIHEGRHFDGHRHAVAYERGSGTFQPLPDMMAEPGNGNFGGGRWYPTLTTLGDGSVYAFQGHPLGTDRRHGNNTPERFQPGTNSWVGLPPVGDVSDTPILYSRLHLLGDGRLFVSSAIFRLARNAILDPATSAVQEIAPLPDDEYRLFASPSVLLPLVPEDGYRARVLLCGGRRSQILDLGNAGAGWQEVTRLGATSNLARANANATLLPTGDVLMTGGTRPDSGDQGAVLRPELYFTPLNRATRTYNSGHGHWQTLDDPAANTRNYHSSALLMPDGRVWTAGGNSAEQPEGAPGASQRTFEIFRPPYPAGPRPDVLAAPSIVTYDENFTFRVTPAGGIGSVVLMRCGSATHAFDGDQRAVYLRFRVSAPDRIVATAPPNGNVAPPGPYMLFAVDRDGRPCEYAKFVSLSTLADDGSRFAAIWREPAAVSAVTRHNLTAAHYQREFDELVGRQRFAPKLVNAHTAGGQPRFSGIWEKSALPAPAFVARHEIDTAALQGELDRLTPQGFRPVVISGYEKNGTHHFAALFEQRQGPIFDARFGLAPGQLQQTHEHNVNHRFRLRMINGYCVGGRELYAAIWTQDAGPESIERHGLSSADYQAAFDENVTRRGLTLTWVSCYRVNGVVKFAAIWDRLPPSSWVTRHGLSAPAYQHEYNELSGIDGRRLDLICGC